MLTEIKVDTIFGTVMPIGPNGMIGMHAISPIPLYEFSTIPKITENGESGIVKADIGILVILTEDLYDEKCNVYDSLPFSPK